jgi:hypothetical protein
MFAIVLDKHIVVNQYKYMNTEGAELVLMKAITRLGFSLAA